MPPCSGASGESRPTGCRGVELTPPRVTQPVSRSAHVRSLVVRGMRKLWTRSEAGGPPELDPADAIPDYAEPIRAWRAWCVVDEPEGPMLRSVFFPDLWEPRRPLLAACHDQRLLPFRRRVAHDAPAKRCECGI